MLTGIFDTHAHYHDGRFDEDRFAVLEGLPEQGVCGVIECGTDVPSSERSRALAEKYPFVWFAAGIHPEDCGDKPLSDLEEVRSLAAHEKCAAIGEIGLDFYWPEPDRETQRVFFERQLQLANDLGLPVIVHDREAHGPTMELMRAYRPAGVLHCFSGSVETMKEAVGLGLYIGLGGAVTFKNARKAVEVAKEVPADRLLLETDCPYMAPVPYRGKRNDSSLIALTAAFLAELRNEDEQALADRCRENALRLFSKIK